MPECICGDVVEELSRMADCTVDAVLCDPPYGIRFMGAAWDGADIEAETDRRERLLLATQRRLTGRTTVGFGKAVQAGTYDFSRNHEFQLWCQQWAEAVYRVLKPGGHLFAFGGPRTYHRLACAIEDAGFEIRDCMMWLYGSGFPKSHDISKAIDKQQEGRSKLREFAQLLKERREAFGITKTEADSVVCDGSTMYSFFEGRKGKPLYFPNKGHYYKLKKLLQLDDSWDGFVLQTNERIIAECGGDFGYQKNMERWAGTRKITAPATPEAQRWDGYGSALKPAWEPVVIAMRPLDGTFAENALKWGVAGLNIDGGRIGHNEECKMMAPSQANIDSPSEKCRQAGRRTETLELKPSGRWPANLAFVHSPGCVRRGVKKVKGSFLDHECSRKDTSQVPFTAKGSLQHRQGYTGPDGLEEVEAWDCVEGCPVLELGRQSGELKTNPGTAATKHTPGMFGVETQPGRVLSAGDTGTAARFYYCAKAHKKERNAGLLEYLPRCRSARKRRQQDTSGRWAERAVNRHPTVKPLELCKYLATLLLPPARETPRCILVPFAGSGSEMIGCLLAGWDEVIGIEKDRGYVAIAEARLKWWRKAVEKYGAPLEPAAVLQEDSRLAPKPQALVGQMEMW